MESVLRGCAVPDCAAAGGVVADWGGVAVVGAAGVLWAWAEQAARRNPSAQARETSLGEKRLSGRGERMRRAARIMQNIVYEIVYDGAGVLRSRHFARMIWPVWNERWLVRLRTTARRLRVGSWAKSSSETAVCLLSQS